MRLGIFGWFVLVGCSTASSAPSAPIVPATQDTTPAAMPAASLYPCTDSSVCPTSELCCPSIEGGTKNVCTGNPKRDCSDHELCGAAQCRAPWPKDRTPPTPSRTHVTECMTSSNCPPDTTCTLFYAQPHAVSSMCVYNVSAGPLAQWTAPSCATDADCKAGVRCVGLTHDPEQRKGCANPGFSPLP